MTAPVKHLDETLSAIADGQLSDAELAAAQTHLHSCDACRAELEAIRTVRSMVRGLPTVEPKKPLVAVAWEPRRPNRLAGIVAAIAAMVAMLLLAGVPKQASGGPEVANLVQVHTTSPVNGDILGQLAPAALPVLPDE